MAKYQTTFGRPKNFKFGEVNIKVGKHPVEIPDEYARKIQKDYPGWIILVSGELETLEPVLENNTEDLETETTELAELETLEPVLEINTEVLEIETTEPVTESKPKKTTKKAAK